MTRIRRGVVQNIHVQGLAQQGWIWTWGTDIAVPALPDLPFLGIRAHGHLFVDHEGQEVNLPFSLRLPFSENPPIWASLEPLLKDITKGVIDSTEAPLKTLFGGAACNAVNIIDWREQSPSDQGFLEQALPHPFGIAVDWWRFSKEGELLREYYEQGMWEFDRQAPAKIIESHRGVLNPTTAISYTAAMQGIWDDVTAWVLDSQARRLGLSERERREE